MSEKKKKTPEIRKMTVTPEIRKMTVHLPQDLFKRICEVSAATGVKKNHILTNAVRSVLQTMEKERALA